MTLEAVKNKKYDEWEVRNALDTLERAEELKQDPKLMEKVEKLAKTRIDGLKKIKWVKK